MTAKKKLKTLQMIALGVIISMLVLMVLVVLNDEATRNDLIEFMLPVLEKFLRQHERGISSILPFIFA